jgi:tetratricopeptide (TPR) repeat protein
MVNNMNSFRRRGIINAIMFVTALVIAIIGINLIYADSYRSDLLLYNKGVAVYNEAELIPEDVFKSPPKFPEENIIDAAAYFQQSEAISNNNEIKSLALYNIATMIGRDYVLFSYERLSGIGLEDAISYLKEAIRLDPDNEDAKYNLEYLERIQIERQESSGGVGSGGSTEMGEKPDRGY